MTATLTDGTMRYGDIVAVDQASCSLPGGAVGLLGRNGAGKSSILKALLGLVRPVSGDLRILELAPEARGVEIRRRVGYMPEKDAYIAGLNGFETVCLAGQMTGLTRLDAARRAHEVLYLVDLGEQRYRLVAEYSTGMRQKVKLATALVHDPELLFLDEPTNGLDPRGRVEMLELIRHLATELGKSIVLSSHILQDVESVCHGVVLLEQGRVLASGPLAELTKNTLRVFLLESTGSHDAVRASLLARGVAEVDELTDGQFRLTIPQNFQMHDVFAAVQDAGGAVHKLSEHRRSLEEVFLGAVRSAELENGRPSIAESEAAQ